MTAHYDQGGHMRKLIISLALLFGISAVVGPAFGPDSAHALRKDRGNWAQEPRYEIRILKITCTVITDADKVDEPRVSVGGLTLMDAMSEGEGCTPQVGMPVGRSVFRPANQFPVRVRVQEVDRERIQEIGGFFVSLAEDHQDVITLRGSGATYDVEYRVTRVTP
jgi:hypothetical protein